MRIALLTEGGYPYARGEGSAWCDRLVRGLGHHDVHVPALSRSARTEAAGRVQPPSPVRRVRAQRLWGGPAGAARTASPASRRTRRARRSAFTRHSESTQHYADLPAAPTGERESGPREAPLAHRAALPAAVGVALGEYYRLLVTQGSTHGRRRQERCGAAVARLRTPHPGTDATRFSRVGEAAEAAPTAHADPTLTRVGRPDPAKDLIALPHAFHAIRREEPRARLRIFHPRTTDQRSAPYPWRCRDLAAQLFPHEVAGRHAVGESPVGFEEIGSPGSPEVADAYAAGDVVVLSSGAEGFPLSLAEAVFRGRPTVSTDVEAVREVIGGTGLAVPPRNPKTLVEAALELPRGPERAARLGTAAGERALALTTTARRVEALRDSYLAVVARHPVHREPPRDAAGTPRPFATPAGSPTSGGSHQ